MSDINSKVPVSIEPIGIQAIMSGTGKQNGTLQYLNTENIKSNNKDFGVCIICKLEIPYGRLVIRPNSQKCVNCPT